MVLHSALLRPDVCGHIWYIYHYYICTVHSPICPLITGSIDVNAFADRLWGDIWFNNTTRKFTRKPADPEADRSFVHFILEPLYKLYSQVPSEETDSLKETLASLGIQLKPIMYKMDVRPLLKVVLDQFFGPSVGLVDMISEHIPSPLEATRAKVRQCCICMTCFNHSSGSHRSREHILGHCHPSSRKPCKSATLKGRSWSKSPSCITPRMHSLSVLSVV